MGEEGDLSFAWKDSSVPAMTDTDLLFTPAVQAAALIRTRKLSPVEYVDAVLAATERANPKINCFREVMVDEARRDAKKAEEAVTRGEKLGPLHGIPISVKDLVDVEGAPTRHGSAIFEGNGPAAADDLLVQRLRDAGAIIIAKATTPEFGVKGLTDGLVRRHAQPVEPRAHAGRLERAAARRPWPPASAHVARHRWRGLRCAAPPRAAGLGSA